MHTEFRDVTEHCLIRIDKEGKWFYEENEIINPHVLHAFCKSLEKDENGRYRIVIKQEICYVQIEDTPFVVATIRGDKEKGISILLNTCDQHKLDPSTLKIGDQNVLYCCLEDGMKVRFSRAAYYQLALMMEEDEKGVISLTVEDTTYRVYPS